MAHLISVMEAIDLVEDGDGTYSVRIDGIVVASVRQDGDNWRPVASQDETHVYDNPLLAAFADANLTDPANWS